MPELTAQAASDLFRSTPHRLLDVGAGSAAYRVAGSGPDVLFVHGWPVSGATFRHLLPHLVDHVTCHVIDLPSAGSSVFDADTPVSIDGHIASVRRIVDILELDDVAVVGHDSGGMIARHAMVGDDRLRAMALIDTEPVDPGWRFTAFVGARNLPGFGAVLGWVAGQPAVRRNKFAFGDAFTDRSLLDGEFAEFFFDPLANSPTHRDAAIRVLRTFDMSYVKDLPDIHQRLDVPVALVWGEHDPFFPVDRARAMVNELPDAQLTVVAGASLFSHEEAPAEVAAAMLPALVAS